MKMLFEKIFFTWLFIGIMSLVVGVILCELTNNVTIYAICAIPLLLLCSIVSLIFICLIPYLLVCMCKRLYYRF